MVLLTSLEALLIRVRATLIRHCWHLAALCVTTSRRGLRYRLVRNCRLPTRCVANHASRAWVRRFIRGSTYSVVLLFIRSYHDEILVLLPSDCLTERQ